MMSDDARLREAQEALTLELTAARSRLQALEGQVERERRRSETLARATEIITSSLDLDTVLRSVLDLAVDVMKAERGFLMLADESGTTLDLAIAHGMDGENEPQSSQSQISQSIVRKVFETGEAVFTTDAQSDPRFNAQNSIQTLHIRSIVCVPLRVKDRTIGVAYLDSRITPNLFSRHDPELLLSFASQAGLAIDNARLYREQVARLREVERLEAFRTRILESIASGVITVDSARTITTFNQAAAQTFGIDAQAMVGKRVHALDALVTGFTTLLDLVQDGSMPVLPHELTGRHPTRGELVLEVRIAPMEIDGGPGYAIAVSDLTVRKELERMHADQVARSKRVEETFSRYLAPHVVQSLMRNPDAVTLGGERQAATILFADIRGFTQLASKLPADRVVELLNSYFEKAVGIVFANDGLLDKFYGDGLMAVFGPPQVRADDATRALQTAVQLQDMVDKLGPTFSTPITIGIGLATGEVVAGHIGSARRMDYTVIGDPANVASRLQAVAPPGAIYCDDATYERSRLRLPAEKMSAKIRGRDGEMTIYAIKR